MSRTGRRSRSANEQNVTQFPAKRRHLRVVTEELAGHHPSATDSAQGRGRAECNDDRPPPAAGPGTRLRRQREARGLSLEDLARTTKINRTILTALETSDVRQLPAAIYTRGFVKAYAREVGLDPELASKDYLEGITALAEQAPTDDAGQLPALARPANLSAPAAIENAMGVDNSMGQFGWVTTVMAIVGLVAYLVYLGSVGDAPRLTPSPVGIEQPAQSDAAPAVHDEPLAADLATAVAGPLRLEIRTDGLCWLVLSVDGEPVLTRLLQPGEYHRFEVDDEAVMRVGDPGALSLSINGRPGRPLGEPGEPADVRITRTNFQRFLAGQ